MSHWEKCAQLLPLYRIVAKILLRFDVRNGCELILFIFFSFILTLNFWELVRTRLFSPYFSIDRLRKLRRSSRHNSVDGPRAADLQGGECAAYNPIGSLSADLFSRSARELSPPTAAEVFCCAPIFRSTLAVGAPPEMGLLSPGFRSRWACSPRHQRLSLQAYGESWLSPSAETLRSSKKGVTPRATLGVTRTWRHPGESLARPRNDATAYYFFLI